MTDNGYTPTTDRVRGHWGMAVDFHRRAEKLAEFDRWLEGFEAKVRADQIAKDAEIAYTESKRAVAWDSERAKTADRIHATIRAQLDAEWLNKKAEGLK